MIECILTAGLSVLSVASKIDDSGGAFGGGYPAWICLNIDGYHCSVNGAYEKTIKYFWEADEWIENRIREGKQPYTGTGQPVYWYGAVQSCNLPF